MGKLSHFRQLEVWQEAHKLVLMVYQVTKEFPKDERFGVVSQMRRAAVSIPANIAEEFKQRGLKDKIRFYNISEGSLEEPSTFASYRKTWDTSHPTTSCWPRRRRSAACSTVSSPAPNVADSQPPNPYSILPTS